MNNVAGIDVSKGKSMVSVLRPFGEVVAKPFSVGHTGSELKELADYLKSLDGETRVVMEHTGRYYEPVARFLHEEGVFVSAVNPKLIKDYGNNTLRKVKTDKALVSTREKFRHHEISVSYGFLPITDANSIAEEFIAPTASFGIYTCLLYTSRCV